MNWVPLGGESPLSGTQNGRGHTYAQLPDPEWRPMTTVKHGKAFGIERESRWRVDQTIGLYHLLPNGPLRRFWSARSGPTHCVLEWNGNRPSVAPRCGGHTGVDVE